MYVRVELALRARPPRHKATSAAAAAAAATAVRTHVRAYTHTCRIERVCLARPIKHTCVHANTRTYIRACTKSNGICSATCQRCLRDRFAQTPFGRAVYVYVTDGRVAFELADVMLACIRTGIHTFTHVYMQKDRHAYMIARPRSCGSAGSNPHQFFIAVVGGLPPSSLPL